MALDDVTKEDLAGLLREAEAAHGEYEKQELGGERDEDWAEWYAEFILKELSDQPD